MSILFTLDQTIAASQERVFTALTDYATWRDWMPNLVQIEPLNGEVMREGFAWRETRRFFGRPAVEEFSVRVYDPQHAFAVVCDGTKGTLGQGRYDIRYDLVPKGGLTHVGVIVEITELSFWGRMMFRVFGGAFKRALSGDLGAMRRHLERVRMHES